MRKKMCSWRTASARATKGETCAEQMTDSFQARAIRSAFVKRLYRAVCAVFIGVLSTYSPQVSCAPVCLYTSFF